MFYLFYLNLYYVKSPPTQDRDYHISKIQCRISIIVYNEIIM